MRHEQSLTSEDVAIVTLDAASNDMDRLLPIIPRALAALTTLERGQIIDVSPE